MSYSQEHETSVLRSYFGSVVRSARLRAAAFVCPPNNASLELHPLADGRQQLDREELDMLRLVKADNGMNIVGQGGVIMLFTLPAAGCAVAARMLIPELVRIPLPRAVLLPFAAALLFAGLALWATALVQLLRDFPRGKLVRSGAYGVCRNPIYSSFALFVLPGLSAFAATWVYGVVGAILCLGVWVFIRKEERELLRVFGDEYREYTARVHRLIPFARGRQVVEQGAPVAHEVFHDKQ